MNIVPISLLCLLFATNLASAADVSVDLISEETGPVDHLFRIENLDHVSGISSSILINLSYYVNNKTHNISGNSSHVINKYTTNTPGHNLTGNISVCANISINESDPQLENNHGCWQLPRIINESQENEEQEPSEEENTEELDCSAIQIAGVPGKIASGTQITYAFEHWQSGDEVRYWVEDAWGNVVKQAITTSSSSARRYTPKNSEGEKGLIIFAQRERPGCEESTTSVAMIVLGEEEEIEDFENSLEISYHPDEAYFGQQIIIGILLTKEKTKKENVLVTLLNEHKELSKSKFQLRSKGSYEFEIPLNIPEDVFCEELNGEYDLLISALGEEIKVPMSLRHKNCFEQQNLSSPISSLYTRNKKFAQEISLRGKTAHATQADLYLLVSSHQLEEDFVINVSPKAGNSSYALLTQQEGVWLGRTLNLSFPQSVEETKPQTFLTNNYSNEGTFVQKANTNTLATGNVILDQAPSDNKSNIIIYLSFIPALLAGGFLLKALRRPKNQKLTKYL